LLLVFQEVQSGNAKLFVSKWLNKLYKYIFMTCMPEILRNLVDFGRCHIRIIYIQIKIFRNMSFLSLGYKLFFVVWRFLLHKCFTLSSYSHMRRIPFFIRFEQTCLFPHLFSLSVQYKGKLSLIMIMSVGLDCLWSVATNGLIVHPSGDIWAWWNDINRGKLLICPPELSGNPTSKVM
jgi:hypothetical protein